MAQPTSMFQPERGVQRSRLGRDIACAQPYDVILLIAENLARRQNATVSTNLRSRNSAVESLISINISCSQVRRLTLEFLRCRAIHGR